MSESPKDPRHAYPQIPPFPQQLIKQPGGEGEMDPKADHGESRYRGAGRLTDRVALITGGDSGIGRAVAIAYAKEGADVVFSYLSEEEDAATTKAHVEKEGRRCLAVQNDQRDPEACEKLVRTVAGEFGKIDILVNNAAYQNSYEGIEDIPADEFDRAFRTNVYGHFFLTQAAWPHFGPGSSIINVASIQSYDPSPGLLPYAATKSALASLTKSLAEWGMERGIRVNGVAPGPVWTPLIPSTLPAEKVRNFGASTLLERPAQPAELAPVFVFLASEDASYVTGEIYGVTGGRKQI
jgi:NAD(P)-dependent dehydrogenase (short-subunit alcohol dehydrogenase family)